jgi:hypothetical protein
MHFLSGAGAFAQSAVWVVTAPARISWHEYRTFPTASHPDLLLQLFALQASTNPSSGA